HADAANQARARLAAQPAALALLMDSPQPAQLADQLGAVTILPTALYAAEPSHRRTAEQLGVDPYKESIMNIACFDETVVSTVKEVLLEHGISQVRQQGPNFGSPMIWVLVNVPVAIG